MSKQQLWKTFKSESDQMIQRPMLISSHAYTYIKPKGQIAWEKSSWGQHKAEQSILA